MRILWLAVAGLVLVGCSNGASKLVGTWHSLAGGAISNYHFHKDGKFEMQTAFDGIFANVQGTYKMDGDRLVMEPTGSTVQGNSPREAEIRQQLGQSSRIQLRWDTPDSFTLISPDSGPSLQVSRDSPQP